MDAIIELILMLVFHWRVGLLVFLAFVIAVCLASLLAEFTGAHGIGLVLIGLAAGLIWQAKADRSPSGESAHR